MMSLAIKLSLLAMVVTLGAGTPLEREFAVKDKAQALSQASSVGSLSYLIDETGRWMSLTARDYRASLYAAAASPHFDKWQAAAGLVTDLGDALRSGGTTASDYTDNMINFLEGNVKPENPAEEFKEALDTIGDCIRRIEQLLPKVSPALRDLRDVAGKSVTEDINETLTKVKEAADILVDMRNHYDRLVEAAGLDD